MKYRVKHASVGGPLTGKAVGDVVTLTGEDEQHLVGLGLVETEDAYQERRAAAVAQETLTVQVETAALSPVVGHERVAELIAAEEDRLLEPFKKGGGWYHFGEGDQVVKVQGRDDALGELARRQATP